MIDITQKGYYEAINNNGEFISKHSSYRVALEVIINSGGGTIHPPIINVYYKNLDTKTPLKGVINSVKTI